MKEIIIIIKKNINNINNFIFQSSQKTNIANLTFITNLIQIKTNMYWYFTQSKYITSSLRLYILGLLFLMISIFNGISGEFFLFLLVFEYVYSNIVKIFNYIVKIYLNEFIISYNNESLLLKVITRNLNEFKNYFKKLLNEFALILNYNTKKLNLRNKYIKKSFTNYFILNKLGSSKIELNGLI